MEAELRGAPLNPSDLRQVIGLSSAGTSYVIDRLEQAGHVIRERNDGDRRVVRLRYTDQGMATGRQFFGPLGTRTAAVIDRFSDDELEVVARFLAEVTDSLHQHLEDLRGPDAP